MVGSAMILQTAGRNFASTVQMEATRDTSLANRLDVDTELLRECSEACARIGRELTPETGVRNNTHRSCVELKFRSHAACIEEPLSCIKCITAKSMHDRKLIVCNHLRRNLAAEDFCTDAYAKVPTRQSLTNRQRLIRSRDRGSRKSLAYASG